MLVMALNLCNYIALMQRIKRSFRVVVNEMGCMEWDMENRKFYMHLMMSI